jgi:hypothetical protein
MRQMSSEQWRGVAGDRIGKVDSFIFMHASAVAVCAHGASYIE